MQIEFKDLLLTITTASLVVLGITVVLVLVLIRQRRNSEKHAMEKTLMQNTFTQEILQTQLETQEATLHHVSEELHDNVGQLLSTTKMLIGITERSLPEMPESLKAASETLTKAIQDLRSLSKSLSNEWLHQFNIIENLQAELDRLKAARQVNVLFTANIYTLPLEPQEQVMLFRVMQEALQNSIKHAHASSIQAAIEVRDDVIYLCLSDNGLGFNMASTPKSGVGMMNMKQRIKLLNGTINWFTEEGQGTRVEINLPAQKIVV